MEDRPACTKPRPVRRSFGRWEKEGKVARHRPCPAPRMTEAAHRRDSRLPPGPSRLETPAADPVHRKRRYFDIHQSRASEGARGASIHTSWPLDPRRERVITCRGRLEERGGCHAMRRLARDPPQKPLGRPGSALFALRLRARPPRNTGVGGECAFPSPIPARRIRYPPSVTRAHRTLGQLSG